jgi:dipeptidyl aminopeptidase/acylaminoacyl peptidase
MNTNPTSPIDARKPRFLFCGQVFTGNDLPVVGNKQLYIADVATQSHTQLTKGTFSVGSFTVSPDNRRAYYSYSSAVIGKSDAICCVDIASGRSKVIHTAQGAGHHYGELKTSPDGKQLAMVHSFDGGNGVSGFKRIVVLNLQTMKVWSAGRLDETSTHWDWHGNADIRISLADPQPNVSAVATVCVATGRGEISRSAANTTTGGTAVSFGKGISVVTRGAGDITLVTPGKVERKVTISLAMQQRMGFIPDGLSLSPLADRVNGRIVVKTASRQNEVTAFGVMDEKLAQIDYWFMSPGHTVFAPKANLVIAWRNIPAGEKAGEPATDSGLQWMALNRTDRWTTILRNQVSVVGDKIVLLG